MLNASDFEPTQKNVAEEIMANAISSATRDPRFPAVAPKELKDLNYSVDVLTKPEPDGTVTFGVINAKEMKGTGPYSIAPVLPRDVHSAGCRAGTLIERLESFIKNQST